MVVHSASKCLQLNICRQLPVKAPVYTQLYLNSSCALAIDSISHHVDSFCLYVKFWVRCMCYICIDLSHVSMLMLH